MEKSTYYTVIHSFAAPTESYYEGEVVEASDPAVKKWPDNFAPLKVRSSTTPAVEQATAAPGEQRGQAITTARFKGRK